MRHKIEVKMIPDPIRRGHYRYLVALNGALVWRFDNMTDASTCADNLAEALGVKRP